MKIFPFILTKRSNGVCVSIEGLVGKITCHRLKMCCRTDHSGIIAAKGEVGHIELQATFFGEFVQSGAQVRIRCHAARKNKRFHFGVAIEGFSQLDDDARYCRLHKSRRNIRAGKRISLLIFLIDVIKNRRLDAREGEIERIVAHSG